MIKILFNGYIKIQNRRLIREKCIQKCLQKFIPSKHFNSKNAMHTKVQRKQ